MLCTHLLIGLLSASIAHAQTSDPQLVGTWTTKSRQVLTGPGFYNPVADRFTEPDLTGISYSFTSDGHYEEAYYRAIANPTNPNCPSGIMQWQHGTYTLPGNGSILLQPIEVDGRQLMSTPCQYKNSIYERYYQPELIKQYGVETDGFHNVQRLNLYAWDGTPQQPLYLAMSPPQMLPTQTLNPTASTAKATAKARRDEQHVFVNDEPLNKHAIVHPQNPWIKPDQAWYAGVGMILLGSILYMVPYRNSAVSSSK